MGRPPDILRLARPFAAIAAMLILVVLALLVSGCAADAPPPATRSFSLTLFVQGRDHTTNPLALTARYLVMDDRLLHVVLGPAANDRTFPKPYRALTVDEFDRLVRFVDDHHLLAEPTSPNIHAARQGRAETPDVRYTVTLTRDGQSNQYTTTPAESPPTVALLAALSSFRGADLDDAIVPQ